jgi:hypothetical protein
MEAATVAGRAAAPAAPPRPSRVPRDRPRPGRKSAPRPSRKGTGSPTRKSAGSPARKSSSRPARKPTARAAAAAAAPARKKPRSRPSSPARTRTRTGPHLIPIAVGTATAVRQFPDSPLMVRMTQGRIWIAVLGVLLVGIVGLNVFTLSLTAEAGHVDQNVVALEKENSILRNRDAHRSGSGRIRTDAAAIGLGMAPADQVSSIEPHRDDIAVAAQRLAAAGTGY